MLILLDIDGVMVPAKSWKRPEFLNDGFFAFSSDATSALQKIISETSADILLTTSHKSKYTIQEWKNVVAYEVKDADGKLIFVCSGETTPSSTHTFILPLSWKEGFKLYAD